MALKFFIERYNSLSEYIETIDGRERNQAFKSRDGLASEKTGKEGIEFTNTESYAEASELAVKGYQDGHNRMQKLNIGNQLNNKAPKDIPYNDVIGFTPNVSNAIIGIPKSMVNKAKSEQHSKVISILYEVSISAGVSSSKIETAGVKILSIINSLELKGYRVALWMLHSALINNEAGFALIQLKHPRQPVNPLKLAYPLVHTSFYRRHGFRFIETCKGMTDSSIQHGYGHVSRNFFNSKEGVIKVLKEQGILQNNWHYVDYDMADKNSPEDLIKQMNLK